METFELRGSISVFMLRYLSCSICSYEIRYQINDILNFALDFIIYLVYVNSRESSLFLQVIQADEENRKLIFSEKEAVWSKFSQQISIGDVFYAKVGAVEDYGAFMHLQFRDGTFIQVSFMWRCSFISCFVIDQC